MRMRRGDFVAIVGAALLSLTVVPSVSDASSSRGPGSALRKGDRLTAPRLRAVEPEFASMATSTRRTVMRDRRGAPILETDGEERVTAVAAGVILAPPRGAMGQVRATAQGQLASSRVPPGCDRLVSSLVRSASSNRLGRCIT